MMTRTSKLVLFFIIAAIVVTFGMKVAGVRALSDREFVQKAASGDKMEVTLGEMAVRQASSPEVRNFGQRLVTDHNFAGNQLMEIADKDHISFPQDMDRMDDSMVKHLSGLKGQDFDRAYMKHMVEDHKNDIEMFQKVAQNSKNPDLKNYARQTLPTLQEHLKLAETISDSLNKQG